MSEEVKIAVLEQKVLDFSAVVEKLDSAITKISEVNSNITKMLAVHDEKIEQCYRSDNVIFKLIEDVRNENSEDHRKSNQRITSLEKEIGEVSKIKWMTIGCGVLLAVLASAFSTLASGWWTPGGMQDARDMQQHQSK
jgi:hypothetical protein